MNDCFPTTRWSIVLRAGEGNATGSRDALEKLCGAYWRPLYFYARRRGHPIEDAQDLVQGYLVRLIQRGVPDDLGPGRVKFRAFLLHSLKQHMADERRHANARKRGGATVTIPLDDAGLERAYAAIPASTRNPEQIYDRQWAFAVVDRVLERLRETAEETERQREFHKLSPFLTEPLPPGSYRKVAAQLEVSEGAVKVAVHRLRKRFGVAMREEIAHTVADPSQVDDEVRYLLSVLES